MVILSTHSNAFTLPNIYERNSFDSITEKEELVNLVLIHVNNYSPDSQSSGRNQCGSNDDRSNPFDQIKNTCQNLFSSFTEKIAAGN